jgi:hypothetical protein
VFHAVMAVVFVQQWMYGSEVCQICWGKERVGVADGMCVRKERTS